MTNQTAFEDIKKAQEIIMDAIDKSTRANLASFEKMLELNKERFSNLGDVTNPAEYVEKQSNAFKEYAEQMNQQFETLTEIGTESRERLAELGQDYAKNLDFSSFFTVPQGKAGSKSKGKATSKSA